MPGKKRARAAKAAAEAEPDEEEDEEVSEEEPAQAEAKTKKKKAAPELEDDADEDDDDEDDSEDGEEEVVDAEAEEDEAAEGEGRNLRVWRPGIDAIEEGEQLDCEPGTYDMLHKAQVEWPCLSFDVVKDELGAQRTGYPMTAYVVAGSQAEKTEDNRIYMMKWSKLFKTSKDGKDESDDDDDDEEEDSDEEGERDAILDAKSVPHPGAVNRIRAMPQAGHIVATWSDTGKVHMWNLQNYRKALDKAGTKPPATAKPIYTCSDHKEEGFAMDFSPHETGKFLSGSNDGVILFWQPVKGGWEVDTTNPFTGHQGSSVEDVHFKRLGDGKEHVFASCGSDKSVRVWDIREANRKKAAVVIEEAHSADVNVLSWSPCVGELLVSGSDDGGFKVWDTRNTSAGPMANFMFHRKPITAVDWHPSDETVLIVSAGDDCVTIWDMAVEDDEVGKEKMAGSDHYPPQLLFLHMGQKDIKEVRWHPQLPGVALTTAGSGFNVFKTCNM